MPAWPQERRANPTVDESLGLLTFQVSTLNDRLIEVEKAISDMRVCLNATISSQASLVNQVMAHEQKTQGILDAYNTASVLRRGILWGAVFIGGLAALITNLEYIRSWFK
jgi:hypothetical protein